MKNLKQIGVIGYPIGHSLSPILHNTYCKIKKLDYTYQALAIKPQDLSSSIDNLRLTGYCGLNVTIPHKVAIMDKLVTIDPVAKTIGAVNTLVAKEDGWHGFNTDAFGFAYPLEPLAHALNKQPALILGAGGAARAVVYALHRLGMAPIYLAVRNLAKGLAFAKTFPEIPMEIIDLADFKHLAWTTSTLIVNTTPLGMTGEYLQLSPTIPWEKLNSQAICYDLIYTPAQTKFLAAAVKYNHPTINGIPMLAAQGAKSLSLWTNTEVDIPLMIKILEDYLQQQY